MVKIIVVEDQGILRDSISYQIASTPDYEVVAKISDASEAYNYAKRLNPDLILMDVFTENGNDGIENATKIKKDFPNIKIIIMTGMPELTYIKRARDGKIDSFIYKNTSSNDLLAIISSTLLGYSTYPKEEKNLINDADLTKREFEVLQLICNGYDQKTISEKLFISLNTVKTHISSLLTKTGFESVHKLAIYAVSNGYIITNNK